MPEEFEGDLAGTVFWGADLSGARFRDVNLTDATISHASLVNVDIDALIDNVVINGVDVTAYVNERDCGTRYTRCSVRPNPHGMRAANSGTRRRVGEDVHSGASSRRGQVARVGQRRVVLRTDAATSRFRDGQMVTAPILGRGFHPIGLPNSGSVDFPWPDLDYDLAPSVSETLAVRADPRSRAFVTISTVATADFTRPIEVLENGTNSLQECIYTVFEEEFWHCRYAQRDLAQLEAAK